MVKPSLSFVVPYYRLELSLLRRCLRSLLAARTDGEPFEIIVVDDGTPPEFGVADFVASLADPRIRYLSQPNAGAGAARNTGLQAARMDYVRFVDADDYLYVAHERRLYDLLAAERPDILVCGYRTVRTRNEEEPPANVGSVRFRGSGADYMLRHNLRAAPWMYIFRRTLAADVRFLTGITREDEDFTPRLFLRAERLTATDIPAYAYYRRSGSVMNALTTERVEKNIDDALFVTAGLRDLAAALPEPQARALRRRVAQLASDILINALCWSADRPFLMRQLQKLKDGGLWRLEHIRPDVRHRVFRLLTAREWQIVSLWRLLHCCKRLRRGIK